MDKLRESIKLKAAITHRSHLPTAKSKLILHNMLNVPNINKRIRVNLM
jgi:hypothetical protein